MRLLFIQVVVGILMCMCDYGSALKVFEECDDTTKCPAGAACVWRGCDGRKCICQNETLPSQDLKTCVPGIELGESCKPDDVCHGQPFSRCLDTKCVCLDKYQLSQDKTHCVQQMEGNATGAEYDQPCTSNNVVCVYDLVCKAEKCGCRTDERIATKEEMHAAPFDYRLCVPEGFSIGTPVNVTGPECLKLGTAIPTSTTSSTVTTTPTTTETTTLPTTVSSSTPSTPTTTTTTLPSTSSSTSTSSTTSTTTSSSTSTTTTTTTTPSTTTATTSSTTPTTTSTTVLPSTSTQTTSLSTSTTPSTSKSTTSATTTTLPTATETTTTTEPSLPTTTKSAPSTEVSSTSKIPLIASPTTTVTTAASSSTTTATTAAPSSSTTSTTTSTTQPSSTKALSFSVTTSSSTKVTGGSISVTPQSHITTSLSSSNSVSSSSNSTSLSTNLPSSTGISTLEPSVSSEISTTSLGPTVGLGDPCLNKACPENSECLTDACNVARCRCVLGYADSPDQKACWKLATLAEICGEEKICQGANTICSDRGICECESGFERSDSGRWCRLKSSWFIDFPVIGEECGDSFSSQCYMYFEQECVRGKCRCKEGFREVATIPDQNAVYPDTIQCRNASFDTGERDTMLCSHQSKAKRDNDVYSRAKSKIHKIQGAIIGGSVGFVALLGIVIGILVLIRWKRKGRQQVIKDTSSTASTDATSRYSFKIPRPFTHFVGSKEFDSTQIAYPNTVFDREDREERITVTNEPKPDVVNVGTLLRQSQNLT